MKMIFLATVVIALLATSVHCQLNTTYLNADSSFVSLQRWDMEPEGAVSFKIRTFQLNASLLYMQDDAGNFIYLELFNGQVRMTLSDMTMVTLPRPFNTNSFRGLQLIRSIAGSLELRDTDFNQNVSASFIASFNVTAPVYVAGIDPSIDANDISYTDASTRPHFVGCIDEFQIGNGSNVTLDFDDSDVLGNSTDVMFGCSGHCNPSVCNDGDCIEYYTRAECSCGPVSEGDGEFCMGKLSS